MRVSCVLTFLVHAADAGWLSCLQGTLSQDTLERLETQGGALRALLASAAKRNDALSERAVRPCCGGARFPARQRKPCSLCGSDACAPCLHRRGIRSRLGGGGGGIWRF